jgi:hypothetical protein
VIAYYLLSPIKASQEQKTASVLKSIRHTRLVGGSTRQAAFPWLPAITDEPTIKTYIIVKHFKIAFSILHPYFFKQISVSRIVAQLVPPPTLVPTLADGFKTSTIFSASFLGFKIILHLLYWYEVGCFSLINFK